MSVLLVEDNPGDARLVVETLRAAAPGAYEVVHVATLAAGAQAASARSFDVVLLDLSLPDSTGIDTISAFRALHRPLACVVLTGSSDPGLASRALSAGAQDYIVKGTVDGESLGRAIRYAVERKRSEEASRESLVAKSLVQRILSYLQRRSGATSQMRREIGRALVDEAAGRDVAAHLRAFAASGIGTLRLESVEGDRYVFRGEGMIDRSPGSPVPTCHFALGYAEALVGAVVGSDALGAEIQCQSRGAPSCVFIVKPRDAKTRT